MEPFIPKGKTIQISELLTVALTCAIVVWYLQFLWSRRKLYKTASRLPGPFSLPLIGSAMSFVGKPHDIFDSVTAMFNTYPGIFKVWFGTRLFYAVSDPKYFEILLSSQHALRKEDLYKMAEPVTGHGLFTAPVYKWKKHRKIIMPTFNQKILDQFVEVFVEQSDVLLKVMEQHVGRGEIDIFDLISKCTLDIICETAMGVQVKAQTTESSFPKWADRIMELVMMRIFNIFYHNESIFSNLPVGREFYSVVGKLRSFTKKVVTEKRLQFETKMRNKEDDEKEETIKRKAFLDLLIEISNQDDNRFTDDELLDETITFMIAGSDTTASTNCFVFTMLGLHQDIQEKVLKEILEVIGPDKNVEVSDLPKLKYMERVIKETLRLFPVGAFIVRAVDEDIDLGDHIVQKGCSVVFGILCTHTNAKYWPDPYNFNPDRFLPEEVAKRHPCAYIPFSFGPRNCLGIRYAMMAMKAVLATFLRKYRIHTSYKNVKEIELKTNLVLRPKYGFKISIELRNID